MKHKIKCLEEMRSNTRLERQLVRTRVIPLSATKKDIWTGPHDHPSPPSPRSFIHENWSNQENKCIAVRCGALIHHPTGAEGHRSCTALHHHLLSSLTSSASTCTCWMFPQAKFKGVCERVWGAPGNQQLKEKLRPFHFLYRGVSSPHHQAPVAIA